MGEGAEGGWMEEGRRVGWSRDRWSGRREGTTEGRGRWMEGEMDKYIGWEGGGGDCEMER